MSRGGGASLVGFAAAVITFLLLAPLQCDMHYVPLAKGHGNFEPNSTGCRGVVAFNYPESTQIIVRNKPSRTDVPRPSLFQPQALITAAIVGILVALIVWLIAAGPQLSGSAKWVMSPILLGISFVSAFDPGGLVIYAIPVLIPVFWWMARQSGPLARAVWAVIAGLLSVEAVALLTYGTSNSMMAPVLVAVGLVVAGFIMSAPRWRELRHPDPLRL